MSLSDSLRKRIRYEMNELADYMAGGACLDWADYKLTAGRINGLAIAERHLLDLMEQMKVAESED